MHDGMPSEGDASWMNLPEETRHIITQQRMQVMQNAHDVRDFVKTLDESQLRIFRGILGIMTFHPESIPYYQGLIGGILSEKFNVCLACSVNHDKELDDIKEPHDHEPVVTEKDKPDKMIVTPVLLEEYSVRPVNSSDPGGPVVCTGPCGGANGAATWATMEDRMLAKRGPAGCNFCNEKEKWG